VSNRERRQSRTFVERHTVRETQNRALSLAKRTSTDQRVPRLTYPDRARVRGLAPARSCGPQGRHSRVDGGGSTGQRRYRQRSASSGPQCLNAFGIKNLRLPAPSSTHGVLDLTEHEDPCASN